MDWGYGAIGGGMHPDAPEHFWPWVGWGDGWETQIHNFLAKVGIDESGGVTLCKRQESGGMMACKRRGSRDVMVCKGRHAGASVGKGPAV